VEEKDPLLEIARLLEEHRLLMKGRPLQEVQAKLRRWDKHYENVEDFIAKERIRYVVNGNCVVNPSGGFRVSSPHKETRWTEIDRLEREVGQSIEDSRRVLEGVLTKPYRSAPPAKTPVKNSSTLWVLGVVPLYVFHLFGGAIFLLGIIRFVEFLMEWNISK
jgi:hypothetical protein